MKKIYIPHLDYTVTVKRRDDFTRGRENSIAVCENRDDWNSIIYIKTPVSRSKTSTLAHEITHVIQNICKSRHMIIEDEHENIPYIMGFLMQEILKIKK